MKLVIISLIFVKEQSFIKKNENKIDFSFYLFLN